MKNYEILSESCKLCWIDNFELKEEKYTQVSMDCSGWSS